MLLKLGIALLAIGFIIELGQKGFLVARRGENPSPIPMRTLAGLAILTLLLSERLLGGALFGGPLPFLRDLGGYFAGWLCAAMLLSAAPYWIVALFRPRWRLLDRLEAALTSGDGPDQRSRAGQHE